MADCTVHAGKAASFECVGCGMPHCSECLVVSGVKKFCRDCAAKFGVAASPTPSVAAPAPRLPEAPKPATAPAARPAPAPVFESETEEELPVWKRVPIWGWIVGGVFAVLLALYLVHGFSSTTDGAKQDLRTRVTEYLDLLKAGAYDRAYKDYWKVHPRPVAEAEGLLAMQYNASGNFRRYEIQEIRTSFGGSAEVSITIVMQVADFSGGAREQVIPKVWRWEMMNGKWFYAGEANPS